MMTGRVETSQHQPASRVAREGETVFATVQTPAGAICLRVFWLEGEGAYVWRLEEETWEGPCGPVGRSGFVAQGVVGAVGPRVVAAPRGERR